MNTHRLTVAQLEALAARARQRGKDYVDVYFMDRLVVEVTKFDPDEGPDETVLYADGRTNRD